MGDDQDLPIALRRTPRTRVGAAAGLSGASRLSATNTASEVNARTPKRQSKKRVRFSDPGPNVEHHDASSATGLTPMVQRTSLNVAPSPKRRRYSAPFSRSQQGGEDGLYGNGSSNEIRFFSLRQVLDDRVKRRIRRNGLSEEMNIISQEKRQRVQKQKVELQRLQHELEEKDREIDRLQNTTMAQDTDRVLELEQEIQLLREELSSRTSSNGDQTRNYDWTLAARDPFSDSYMDADDDHHDNHDRHDNHVDEAFGDATMADLICSTPSRNRASASFPTPPCTSPTIPSTPCSLRRSAPVTPQSHIGIQTVLPDPDKEALEAELGSLRLELAKLTKVLESHEAFKARISDKLNAAEIPTEPSKDVETHLDAVLQSLSDKTATLLDLNSSLSSLGFAGNNAGEIMASLAGAFRSARLELEYLTPGEITLPLSSRGAEVLDLVLVQLRSLARQVRENEEAIDEYHELELSLREQLNARVDAMDSMRERSRVELAGKDERIADLEVGMEHLKSAADGYRRDVAELESLVQSMEEGKVTEKRLTAEVAGAQAELADSKATIVKLEAKLASVHEQAENFRLQLAELQRRKAAEVKALNKYHGMALAVRDTRVADLRRALDEVNSSLHEANTTIQQLRVENIGLNQCLEEERNRAMQAVDTMKADLERMVKMSSEFLSTPLRSTTSSLGKTLRSSTKSVAERAAVSEYATTPDSGPLGSEACFPGELAKINRGTKRRKHDSGLGLLDEDEAGSVEQL
ncbi:uncharacterized protein F4812DRAFT_140076 [Daldinia caldariorum]|uniref:uncharacterized protein n=1 Tax=Daldinia caldariorum TaxID=326644 RepID=UPI002007E1EC|nr:uncharacterized protein F4812DRAFT_140076 [Daldinia caldariorum]KAI1464818.1 hypothetical protein F4812DRAFT_140076 [Daldinia caldariorum]